MDLRGPWRHRSPAKGASMNSLVASSISWANVQARVQPPRRLSPRWAKDRAKVLQDIYWRMRLVGMAGVLSDCTTWNVCVPPEEKMLAHVDWWDKRWVQFNFSSPVASNFMSMPGVLALTLTTWRRPTKAKSTVITASLSGLALSLQNPATLPPLW